MFPHRCATQAPPACPSTSPAKPHQRWRAKGGNYRAHAKRGEVEGQDGAAFAHAKQRSTPHPPGCQQPEARAAYPPDAHLAWPAHPRAAGWKSPGSPVGGSPTARPSRGPSSPRSWPSAAPVRPRACARPPRRDWPAVAAPWGQRCPSTAAAPNREQEGQPLGRGRAQLEVLNGPVGQHCRRAGLPHASGDLRGARASVRPASMSLDQARMSLRGCWGQGQGG